MKKTLREAINAVQFRNTMMRFRNTMNGEYSEVTCPRCALEFHTRTKKEEKLPAHLCSTGYIKPLKSQYCTDCKRSGTGATNLKLSYDAIVEYNRRRKIEVFYVSSAS